MRKLSKSLTGALSEVLILSLLKNKPGYGYEIIKNLSEITNGKLNRQSGSIYPLLNKMEGRGWIKSEWDIDSQRPRRIYNILKNGIMELEFQKDDWNEITTIINKLDY